MKNLPLFILFFGWQFSCFGQFAKPIAPTDSLPKINKQYLKAFLEDPKDIILAPIRVTKMNAIKTVVLAGVGYLIFQNDMGIQSLSQSIKTPTTEKISQYGLEPFGGYYTGGIVGACYLYGAITKNIRAKKVALLAAKTFIVAAPFIFVSKALFYRDRPYFSGGPDYNQFRGILYGINHSKSIKNFRFNTSFPSGHTTAIFAVATVFATEFKDKPIIPIIAYSVATLTGLSRIHDNKHWASDVFVGALFGYGMAKVMYKKNNAGFLVTPYKSKDEIGLNMVIPIR